MVLLLATSIDDKNAPISLSHSHRTYIFTVSWSSRVNFDLADDVVCVGRAGEVFIVVLGPMIRSNMAWKFANCLTKVSVFRMLGRTLLDLTHQAETQPTSTRRLKETPRMQGGYSKL